MILLIGGASHTGKTVLAQRLLEKLNYPYYSIDHLKMGLIRAKKTKLTVEDDEKLSQYLWPIVRETIKTAIENDQNLIIEGCYIPFDWQEDFDSRYLKYIQYVCLIFAESYIENNYEDILKFASKIEKRLNESHITKEFLIEQNRHNLEMCQKYNCSYHLILDEYDVQDVFADTE